MVVKGNSLSIAKNFLEFSVAADASVIHKGLFLRFLKRLRDSCIIINMLIHDNIAMMIYIRFLFQNHVSELLDLHDLKDFQNEKITLHDKRKLGKEKTYTGFEEFIKKEVIESKIKTKFEHEEDEMYIDFEAVNDLVKEEFIPSNVKEEPKGIDNVSFQAQNKQDLKGIFRETIFL